MALDVLAVCAHPDDAELTCAGLLLRAKAGGAAIGVCDLTRGEAGTRGTAAERDREAAAASAVLGLDERVNLEIPDGAVTCTLANRVRLIEVIRAHRPRLLIAPYWEDHHPDHANASHLAKEAWWFAGVGKHPGGGAPHRPEAMLHYMSRYQFRPSLVVDISDHWERKRQAAACYRSQLHDPQRGEPETAISSPGYLEAWEGRHRYYGSLIGVDYGEPYLMRGPVPIGDPMALAFGRRAML